MPDSTHRPLRHPLFVSSLALLVVNDHLLKGSGAPSWLTGKLSDFAGLVVAPVLLHAAWVGARRRWEGRAPRGEGAGRSGTSWHSAAIAMALVTLGFVATELWQPAADVVARALGLLGVPSRLWADPTDLLALAVLPVTWQVLRGSATPHEPASTAWSRASSRTLFAMGVLACVATSPRPATWSTSAYLLNGTDAALDVRLRWASVSLSCSEVGTRTLSTIVAPEVLTRGTTFRVAPGATIPLDDWAALAARGEVDAGFGAPRPPSSFGEGCVIGLVATDGLPDTLVLWPTETILAVPTTQSAGELPATGRVELTSAAVGLELSTSSDLRAEAYDARTMPRECALDLEIGTSEAASFEGPSFEIRARSATVDDCVRLDFAMGTRAVPFFVCAPAELVPFDVGDFVRVDASDDLGVHRVALVDADHTLVLLRVRAAGATAGVVEGGVTLSIDETERCLGARLDCGSFVVPHEPHISGAAPGEDPHGIVMRTSPMGRAMRIQIARAESVIAASPTCAEGRDEPGALLDAVVLYE